MKTLTSATLQEFLNTLYTYFQLMAIEINFILFFEHNLYREQVGLSMLFSIPQMLFEIAISDKLVHLFISSLILTNSH